MITKEEVKHIAKLSRLGLQEKEIEKIQNDLSLVLDYIEKLKEVDVSNTKPYTHSVEIENILRNDERKEKKSGQKEKLLDLMPDKENNYLKTKSVF